MNRILRVGIIAAAILIIVLEFFGIRDFSRSPYTGIRNHNLIFRSFREDSPNRHLSLRSGDRIVSVDGVVPRNLNHFNCLVYNKGELKDQIYMVARGDSVFHVTVSSIDQPQKQMLRKFSLMIVGITLVIVGTIVILKRPDILGFLFTVNCLIFAFLLTDRPITSIRLFHIAGELLHDFCFIFLPAFFLHFFFIFPGKEITRGSRRSRAVDFLYLPPTLLFLSIFILALLSYSRGIRQEIIHSFETVTAIYWAVYMIASIVVFVRTYLMSERVQRIKFRIALLGVALGILPISAVMLITQFQRTFIVPYDHLAVLFLSFISISFAYTILKHDAFDLGIVFRKSTVYLLLTVLLVAAYYSLVNVLGERFSTALGLRQTMVSIIAVIFIAATFIPAKTGIQRLVDKAFYRTRKVFRDSVIEFSRKIQFLLSFDDVSGFVTEELQKIFEAESVHLFLRDDEGKYTLRNSYPVAVRVPLTSFPRGTYLMQLMKDERLPLMIEYFDGLWIRNYLDRMSRELLSMSGTSVVIPLIEQQELFGFILLGGKKSGRPYTKADSEILELLGERSAIALRSIELYRDSIEKEKLEEEIHLASEIQRRLLPAASPRLRKATLLATLKNSREVGGDFYDFVEFSPGKIGIAVSDVSGKGIPASMLMTTLQASFRAEVEQKKSPGKVLAALSKSLYERSDVTKFATFFYATYDDDSGRLHYANGGSFPPIILHGDGRVSRLHRGGLLIGVETDSKYSEGVVKLKKGDLVIIYTDGVNEQRNNKSELFGEKRLIEFLRNNEHLSLEDILAKLFATLLAFGQNNLHDDTTVVLLRKNIA